MLTAWWRRPTSSTTTPSHGVFQGQDYLIIMEDKCDQNVSTIWNKKRQNKLHLVVGMILKDWNIYLIYKTGQEMEDSMGSSALSQVSWGLMRMKRRRRKER